MATEWTRIIDTAVSQYVRNLDEEYLRRRTLALAVPFPGEDGKETLARTVGLAVRRQIREYFQERGTLPSRVLLRKDHMDAFLEGLKATRLGQILLRERAASRLGVLIFMGVSIVSEPLAGEVM